MREAEVFLEQNKPILAVFDLMMEQHDSGFILAYKSKKMYPEVPVIICTSVAAETGLDFTSKNEWVKADLVIEKGKATSVLAEKVTQLLKK
jgi:CheY-like chemotaxis protein